MQGATDAPTEPELITSKFGFVENAEIVNSRAAMVGISLSTSLLNSKASAAEGSFQSPWAV